jgi:LacI family transcriptional regulator
MRDIARASGVSVSAVSLALKDSTRVSEQKRRAIREVAAKLGYQPDPMLSALSHYRRSKTAYLIGSELAWINCWPTPSKLRSYHEFDLYWQGAFEEAKQCGFRLEEFRTGECKSPARLEAILRARNITGILLPPRGGIAVDWSGFNWEHFCLVRFGHSHGFPRVHLVTSDQLTDGMIAYENIWKKGYRRIAYATTRDTAIKGTRFSAGFFQGQLNSGTKSKLQPLLFDDEKNAEKDRRQLAAWLKSTRPDAILTDLPNLQTLLAKCGCRVPQDIGLAVTSVLDGEASAGIDQNSWEIGKAAIQLLISLINHNERGIPEVCRELLIEGRWADGDTLPAKPAPAGK